MLCFSSKAQHLPVAVGQLGVLKFIGALSGVLIHQKVWSLSFLGRSLQMESTAYTNSCEAPSGLAVSAVREVDLQVHRQKYTGKSHCWWRHTVLTLLWLGPAVHFRTEVDTAGMWKNQSISKSVGAEIGGNYTASYSPIHAGFLTAWIGLTPLSDPSTGAPD